MGVSNCAALSGDLLAIYDEVAEPVCAGGHSRNHAESLQSPTQSLRLLGALQCAQPLPHYCIPCLSHRQHLLLSAVLWGNMHDYSEEHANLSTRSLA